MSEVFNVRYEGCGHTCRYEPSKYPEGSLIFDIPATASEQHETKIEKGKGKEITNPSKPLDQPLRSDDLHTQPTRSTSLDTLSSIEGNSVATASTLLNTVEEDILIATAPQSCCPSCFSAEEDRICTTYAKRVKQSIEDCDKCGLTESETLHLCGVMEADHEDELREFHAASGYDKQPNQPKEQPTTARTPIKNETLRGLFATAKTIWAKSETPRCANPVPFQKTDIGSDNLALARAEWGAARSATPWLSVGKVDEQKDYVDVARPRRDGTRSAFPVRIPKSNLKKMIDAIKTMGSSRGLRPIILTDIEIANSAGEFDPVDLS